MAFNLIKERLHNNLLLKLQVYLPILTIEKIGKELEK
jgi:hypothetical protein